MKQQNFFEDPKGVLHEIQQQSLLLQRRPQDPQQQPAPQPQILPQQRRRLSTFTAPSMVQPSPSMPLTTATSPLAYPSTSSLGSEQPQPSLAVNRRPKPGILRLDMSKPRRSSGGSVEFRMQPHMYGANTSTPTGTTPPPHQLSVTWATPPCGSTERDFKTKPSTPAPGALIAAGIPGAPAAAPATTSQSVATEYNEIPGRKRSPEEKPYEFSLSYAASNLASPVTEAFIDFPLQRHYEDYNQSPGYSIHTANTDNNDDDNDEDDDEEDYSVSVSAIMQRRASVRGYRRKSSSRNSRRASSPMDHVLDNAERRRSSVYTTSSDEGTNQESTQEQIFENIRLHKEVIQSVKLQPWPIRKKLKLVRQAKTYVARHEGALQERFAMSRSTRDLWARFKIVMAARWRHWKRETYSFLTVLIPWELRIKEIESHFGSGVASYFTFLRWLMYMNVMIALPLLLFVIGPEYFATKKGETDPRKKMSAREEQVAGNLLTIWEFEGYLKYSPMFYGYYSSISGASLVGYMLPLAYFLTAVVVYIYSFVATLRKMAENSRNSKLSSKDDECTFSWKLFTGWDFMIGHAETAHNRIASVVVGFKEALLEEAEKKKDKRNWRIILQRILVNILVIVLLAASGVTVVTLVNMSEELAKKENWLSKNAVNVTMNLLSFLLPMIFEALGLFENWHPRQQLRLQLARIMILNLLTLYSLMFSFIYKINSKEKPLIALKELNDSTTIELNELRKYWNNYQAMTTTLPTNVVPALKTTTEAIISTTAAAIWKIRCYNQTVQCTKPWRTSPTFPSTTTMAATTLMLFNLSTTMMTNPPITTTIGTTTTEQSTETMWTTLMPPITTIDTTTMATTTTMMDFKSSTLDLLTTTTTTSPYSNVDGQETTQPLTTEEETSSPTTMISTTTTDFPGSDKFFEYYDYFDGESELPDSESATAELNGKNKRDLKNNADGTTNEVYKTTLEPQRSKSSKISQGKAANVKKVKLDNGRGVASLKLLRKSKYSRRDRQDEPSTEGTATDTTTTGETESTNTTPTGPPSTTLDFRLTTDFDDVAASPESLPITQTPEDNSDDSTTTTTSKGITWEHNNRLEELADFFTMKQRNGDKTTTKPTPTTVRHEEDQLIDDGPTTPFYLEGEQETGQTVSYDLYELDDGTFSNCVRTVCYKEKANDKDLSGATTPATTTTTQMSAEKEFHINQTILIERLEAIEINLTTMCWETSLGQELAKVVVLDGITATVLSLCIDFLRALFVRYVNQNWCWDMEKTFPQYGDFKIAENILALINNQGQVWMGIFFSPGLVIINLVKLVIMMYFRSWIVLTCNVPHEVVFKASKSNNFYLSLLLTMLFLCVLPVGYAIVWLRPSWHCGPYSKYIRISDFITTTTKEALPQQLHDPLNYLTSSSTVIPLLLLLILIIYYLVSLTGALREANQDLRTQLQKEREEERKKFFKLPEIKPAENSSTTLTNRWRKVLDASSPITPTEQPDFESEEYKNQARKELISRIMKKALRKDSATSDEEPFARHGRDDDTDTEHHDSLPHDEDGNEKRPGLSKLQEIRRTRKPSLVDIVQIANSERERVRSLRKQALVNGGGKSKPKVDKTEKSPQTDESEKFKNKEKDSTDNGNDPEIKTRVINERRQSLLRKRKEEDSNEADKEYGKENEKEYDKEKEKENIKKLDKDTHKNKDLDKDKAKEYIKKKDKVKSKDGHNGKKDHLVDTLKDKDNDNDNDKDKAKDTETEEVVKLKLNPPIKNRIYESFRRKKREDKEKSPPIKQNSLEKTNEELDNADPHNPPANGNKKKSLRKKHDKHVAISDDPDKPEKSSYKVVDEKSPPSHEEKHSPPVLEQLHNLGGKLKFKRHKPKAPSTEPEVFKFESEKISKEADIATTPTWQHLEAELQTPRTTEEVTTPTSLNHLNLGADKLASLSRQSRKKIGSFLALMKDAVSRPEHEQLPDTAIEIPSTPRTEMSTALNNAFMLPVAMHTTATHSIQPYIMPRAPLELPEDIDPPSYNHSMAANENNAKSVKDPEELDKPGPITFPQRGISQRRRPVRQDSQSSNWSADNIPTITISVTPEGEDPPKSPLIKTETLPSTPSPGPKVNVIKINIEHEK